MERDNENHRISESLGDSGPAPAASTISEIRRDAATSPAPSTPPVGPNPHPRIRGPKRTEDERMLERQLPDDPVSRAVELGAFTHTEGLAHASKSRASSSLELTRSPTSARQ